MILKTNTLLLSGSLLGAVSFISCQEEVADKQPNIIYILADDLGYGDLGCYGQQKIETPNIDRLAKEGIRFTQNYSGSAVSAPSRCVLMTGLHTGHTYIRGNDEMGERGDVWSHEAMLGDPDLEGQRPIPGNTVTIASKMKEAGYTTACIGKWGLGYPDSEATPNKMGFDFFYGYNCQRMAHTYYPPFLYRNDERVYLDNKVLQPGVTFAADVDIYDKKSYEPFTQNDYSPDLMFDEITQFVSENKENPFMLMWTSPIPHVPLQAPKEWVDHYVEKFGDEKPYVGERYYPCRYPRATYAAMVSYWDEQIGQLCDQLKELGIYDNTLIIFTSDNGPTFNGGSDSPWFDSASPFRSDVGYGKCYLREGGIRVPMIATWKDKIKPNTTTDHISASWDIMPTLCGIANIETPPTDGISFLPTLLGDEQTEHEYLYWEFPELDGARALRMGMWKAYIDNIKSGNDIMELYNLEEDPSETTDVAHKHPEVMKVINAKMKEAHVESPIKRFNM